MTLSHNEALLYKAHDELVALRNLDADKDFVAAVDCLNHIIGREQYVLTCPPFLVQS
jgi:hypothetical protein